MAAGTLIVGFWWWSAADQRRARVSGVGAVEPVRRSARRTAPSGRMSRRVLVRRRPGAQSLGSRAARTRHGLPDSVLVASRCSSWDAASCGAVARARIQLGPSGCRLPQHVDLCSGVSRRHHPQFTRHQAPGTRHQAPGTRHQAPGTRHQAPALTSNPVSAEYPPVGRANSLGAEQSETLSVRTGPSPPWSTE